MAKMTGICFVELNGSRVRSKDATLKPGGPISKAVADDNGVAGHATEEVKPSEVQFSMPHGNDVDITAWQRIRGATVVFETDSDQRYLIKNAGTEGEVSLKGKGIDITLSGEPAELM